MIEAVPRQRTLNSYPLIYLLVDTPQLASPGALIRRALQRYRDEARAVLGLAGLYAASIIGLAVVAGAVALGGLIALRGDTLVLVIGGFVLALLAGFGLLWLTAVFNLAFVELAAADEPQSMWAVFDRGRRGALAYLWLIVVQAAFVVGGYVLFIVPGIIFSVLAAVSAFVFVAEDKRGVAAIARSWTYIRNRKWAVLWRLFVYGVLLAIVFVVARIVVLLVTRNMGPFATYAISEVVSLGLDFFVAVPVSVLFMGALYKSVRATRPEPPEEDAGERERHGTIIGFSLFGMLVMFAYVALVLLGALLMLVAATASTP